MIGFLIGELASHTTRIWDHLDVCMCSCFMACLTVVCKCECVAAFALYCTASCSEPGRCSLTSERSVESNVNSLRMPTKNCALCVHHMQSVGGDIG